MNVINESSFGGNVGKSLGSGISKTLDMLTNSHLNKIAERHQFENNQRGLNALGANPELAYLPQHLQQLAVKNQLGEGQRQNIAQVLGSLLGNGDQQNIAQSLAGLDPASQFRAVDQIVKNQENQKRDLYRQQQLNNQERQIESNIASKQAATQQRESALGLKQIATQSKINSEEKKLDLAKQKEINKQNKEYNSSLDNELKNLPILEKKVRRAKEIISGGKSATRAFGYLPTALLGEQSQELEGLSSDILNLLGQSAPTDAARKILEQSKISLKQGRPAQMKAAERLDDMIQLIKAQDKIRAKLIKENGGNQPANLAGLVQQQLENHPKLINLKESISKELSKDKIMELPLGRTFQGKDGQWYTRVKYGSGVRPATSEEVSRGNNG